MSSIWNPITPFWWHSPQGHFNPYVYVSGRHMSSSRLESSVITCGGHKPHGLYNSNAYVFRGHIGHSRIAFSFSTCGRFQLWVHTAQACGAMESALPCTVMAVCYHRIQVPHFVFATSLPSYSIRNEEVSGFSEQVRKILDSHSL